MNEKLEWEQIADEGLRNYKTHRLRVDGGYIYRYKHDIDAYVIFVPDSQPNVSQDGELSNVEWSDYKYLLREIKLLQERIEKLESAKEAQSETVNLNLLKRIEKLEQRMSNLEIDSVPRFVGYNAPLESPPCDHDWDVSQILTSNPPKVKCKKCRTFRTLDDKITFTTNNAAPNKYCGE